MLLEQAATLLLYTTSWLPPEGGEGGGGGREATRAHTHRTPCEPFGVSRYVLRFREGREKERKKEEEDDHTYLRYVLLALFDT